MGRMPASERREQLLDRAAELFAQRGYARTTTAELARAAGVTEPIIYRHFDSKKAMYIALIERTGRRTLEQWERHLEGAGDAAERLRRLIGDNPMVTPEGRDEYRVFLQAISEVEQEPDVAEAVQSHIRRVHAFLEAEVSRAQDTGRVPKRYSAELLAWVMMSLGLGYGAMRALGMRGHGIDRDGVHMQEVIERVFVGRA